MVYGGLCYGPIPLEKLGEDYKSNLIPCAKGSSVV